ncbi:hypothetical protein NDU88_003956 [Pleurodeles waltl]|uniref:Uncharacterized protein n=1 Tax=Pleurodeles waltl TaxID=8319 RepID=A0AAV7TPW5_PLEWA|nr:hypothetical protein NDU88_003956 [Pleurodeles waltl]
MRAVLCLLRWTGRGREARGRECIGCGVSHRSCHLEWDWRTRLVDVAGPRNNQREDGSVLETACGAGGTAPVSAVAPGLGGVVRARATSLRPAEHCRLGGPLRLGLRRRLSADSCSLGGHPCVGAPPPSAPWWVDPHDYPDRGTRSCRA